MAVRTHTPDVAGTAHDRQLAAVRAVAALAVVTQHTLGVAGGSVSAAVLPLESVVLEAGLGLFFVLSGYLIGGPFIRALVDGDRRPAVGQYALRRVLRIMPGYLVAFGTTAVVLGAMGAIPTIDSRGWQHSPLGGGDYASGLVFADHWMAGNRAGMVIPAARTLSQEVAFYLAVPLVALPLLRLRRRVTAGAVATGLVVIGCGSFLFDEVVLSGRLPGSVDPVLQVFLAAHAGYLCLFVPGCLIALMRTRAAAERWPRFIRLLRSPEARGLVPLAVFLALLATVAIHYTNASGSAGDEWRRITDAVAAMFLVAGALAPARSPGMHMAARLLAPLGTISFGIYLYHEFVLAALGRTGTFPLHVPGALMAPAKILVTLLCVLPLATISWVLVERPAQSLARHRGGRRPAAARPTPVAVPT